MPRPTAYLSASLLLLPVPAFAAPGWSCQTGANGAWVCQPQNADTQPNTPNNNAPTAAPVPRPSTAPATVAPSAGTSPTQPVNAKPTAEPVVPPISPATTPVAAQPQPAAPA